MRRGKPEFGNKSDLYLLQGFRTRLFRRSKKGERWAHPKSLMSHPKSLCTGANGEFLDAQKRSGRGQLQRAFGRGLESRYIAM